MGLSALMFVAVAKLFIDDMIGQFNKRTRDGSFAGKSAFLGRDWDSGSAGFVCAIHRGSFAARAFDSNGCGFKCVSLFNLSMHPCLIVLCLGDGSNLVNRTCPGID
jgi:hypothetical protein